MRNYLGCGRYLLVLLISTGTASAVEQKAPLLPQVRQGSVSEISQGSAPAVIKGQTGQRKMIDRSVGIPKPNISGDGKDFSVVSFWPRVIPLKPGGAAELRVLLEFRRPRDISARVEYKNPYSNDHEVIEYGPCVTTQREYSTDEEYKIPKRDSCVLDLSGLPRELTSITIYMYSSTAVSDSNFDGPITSIRFDVATLPVQTTRKASSIDPASKGTKTQNGRDIPRDNAASNRIDPARPGDTQSLNPQPIPPGRGETALNNNPGDPSPIMRNDSAIIFQRGLKNNPAVPSPTMRPGDTQSLNPQPIPPGKSPLGDRQALNPQPIPPGHSENALNNSPGDPSPIMRSDSAIIFQRGLKNNPAIPSPTMRPGDTQSLNPQPIPPGRGETALNRNPGDPPPTIVTNAGIQRPQSFPMANRTMSTSMMEMGVNRYGGDYASRDLGTAEQCRAACNGEAQCKAWSWVKPGIQGSNAKCWLKNTVPPLSRNDCCVSGVK